jgi:hypothetical protein
VNYFFKAICLVFLTAALYAQAQEIPTSAPEFTEHVAARMRKELPPNTEVTVKSPLTLGIGELQANLDRVFGFCKSNQARCDAELSTYVKGAAEVIAEQNKPISKDAVRVVVRTSQYVESSKAASIKVQPKELVKGLWVLPVLDTPRAIRPIIERDNDALGLSAQQVFDLGISNVKAAMKPVLEIGKVADAGKIGQLVGDSYFPSRLALLESWEPLVAAQGGVLIVVAPTTDAVLYVGQDDAKAIDALRAIARDVLRRAPNKLSDTLLRWKSTGWEIVN